MRSFSAGAAVQPTPSKRAAFPCASPPSTRLHIGLLGCLLLAAGCWGNLLCRVRWICALWDVRRLARAALGLHQTTDSEASGGCASGCSGGGSGRRASAVIMPRDCPHPRPWTSRPLSFLAVAVDTAQPRTASACLLPARLPACLPAAAAAARRPQCRINTRSHPLACSKTPSPVSSRYRSRPALVPPSSCPRRCSAGHLHRRCVPPAARCHPASAARR